MLRQFSQRLARAVPVLRQSVQAKRTIPAVVTRHYSSEVVDDVNKRGHDAAVEQAKVTIAEAHQSNVDVDPEDVTEAIFVNGFRLAEDSWEVEDVINNMQGEDRVPLPSTVIAGLQACRRIGDHSLAVRFMEAVRFKARVDMSLWDFISQEIEPTLKTLGITSLEEMGYTKPELACQEADDIFAKKFEW